MKVIANRQLEGSYGTFTPGTEKDLDDSLAAQLLKRGLVRAVIETPVAPVVETPTEPVPEQPAVKVEAPTPKIEIK